MNPGYFITSASVLISAVAVIITWQKDKKARRRDSADRVRSSAGLVIAKIERFQHLALFLFDEVQPTFTEADIEIVKSQDIIKTRDLLWQQIVAAHARTAKRILDEQIEIAYADLHG